MIFAGGHVCGDTSIRRHPRVWLRAIDTADVVPYSRARRCRVVASMVVKAPQTGLVAKAASLTGAMTPDSARIVS